MQAHTTQTHTGVCMAIQEPMTKGTPCLRIAAARRLGAEVGLHSLVTVWTRSAGPDLLGVAPVTQPVTAGQCRWRSLQLHGTVTAAAHIPASGTDRDVLTHRIRDKHNCVLN